MEDFFGEKDFNEEKEFDEIILDQLSLELFSGDIKEDYYSIRSDLTSLDYHLYRSFGIDSFEQLVSLKKRVLAKRSDLEGGSNLLDFECDKPKGVFLNRLRIPFRS